MPEKASAVADLEARLDYTFKDKELLLGALTHPSAAPRAVEAARTYERLEFLGDRVLGLIISEKLLELHPASAEGDLAQRHAALVKRETLAEVAQTLELWHALRVGKSERAEPRGQTSILADALEALIAALYLDGGLKAAQKFIKSHFAPLWQQPQKSQRDPKTALQEWVQGRRLPQPQYTVIEKTGPAHAPLFVVSVATGKDKTATAKGPSKQAAEKLAAAALLAKLEGKA